MDPYFEASDDERDQGLKEPTDVHRAIANLVREGVVRVIVTTNFDRLIERALQDIGIEPTVIASADDARTAAPLHTLSPVVIKVHGDRRSPNLKNTLSELDTYESELEDLLATVFRDYGLVVVGWSAEWDPALRSLLIDHQPTVFSTFFAHRGNLSEAAQEVIKRRTAIAISIEDAGDFFLDVEGKVRALKEIGATTPTTGELAVTELKLYIPDPEQRIRLRDLVHDTMENLLEATGVDVLPVEMDPFELSDYFERIADLDAISADPVELLATLAFYADEARHDDLLVRSVDRLANRRIELSGRVLLLALQRYPAMLALYGMAITDEAARSARIADFVVATEIADILDVINERFALAQITREESEDLENPEELTALLMDLPSRRTVFHLRKQQHENPQTKWQESDLNDLTALGVAVPYCDVVVTERRCVHHLERAQLDEAFNTTFLSDMTTLIEYVV